VSWTAVVLPVIAVAESCAGAAGPLLSTTTFGLSTVSVLPAALVASTLSVCVPSASIVVFTLTLPDDRSGQGCVCE
jgi:hypothetical protein